MNTIKTTATAFLLSLVFATGAYAQEANDGENTAARSDSADSAVTLSVNDTTTVKVSSPINITVNGASATANGNRVHVDNTTNADAMAKLVTPKLRSTFMTPWSKTTTMIKDSLGATNQRIDEVIFVLNSVIQNSAYTDGVADIFVQQRMRESGFAGNDEAAMRLARDAREYGDLEYVEDAQKTALAEIWRLRCKIEVNEKGIFILQEETRDLQIEQHGNKKERQAAKNRNAGRYERKKRTAKDAANARDLMKKMLDANK